MAVDARACLKGLIMVSRGRLVRSQGDRGVPEFSKLGPDDEVLVME